MNLQRWVYNYFPEASPSASLWRPMGVSLPNQVRDRLLRAGVTLRTVSKSQGFGVSSAERWFTARYAMKEARLQTPVLTLRHCSGPAEQKLDMRLNKPDKQAHHCDVQNPQGKCLLSRLASPS